MAETLPDGRAYEQVTPVAKNGLNVQGEPAMVQAAAAGAAVVYPMKAALPGSEGAQNFPTMFTTARDAGSWATAALQPPAALASNASVIGWNEGLTESFSVGSATVGGPKTLYARDNSTGALTALGEVGTRAPSYVGGATDGAVLAFESKGALTPAAVNNKPNVYVWDRATDEVSLASILNSGSSAATKGAFAGPFDWWEDVLTRGGAERHYFTQATHVLAANGSSIYFTASVSGALYQRRNPTAAQSAYTGEEECSEADVGKACTYEVSRPNTGVADPEGEKPAAFMDATPDGSRAFFTSSEKLTADATTGPTDEGDDLYMYEADAPEGQRLTDLTPDAEPGDANGAEVRGVVGVSNDGSYVYFVANGVLDQGAARGDCTPLAGGNFVSVSGECNLYLWHDGAITWIARLDGDGGPRQSDAMDWVPTAALNFPAQPTARLTPEGTTLVFASQRRLTEYDNQGQVEFYRYSAAANLITCISCDPSGAAPVGGASLENNAYETGASYPAAIEDRNLSASGDRFFFQSPDKLVDADVNGEDGCESQLAITGVLACQDVYEWEAPEVGSCRATATAFVPASAGCIYLISPGTSISASFFADANEEGEDVFFYSLSQLVSQDRDQLVDIYDARVGGGLASQNEEEPPVCVGETCRGSAQASPAGETSGTASYVGPTNPSPACRKGSVRRDGRCVRKKHHAVKKHHARKRKAHKSKKHHQRKGSHGAGKGMTQSGGAR